MAVADTKTKMTPPELARHWGVSADKILAWIRAGELRAIDASSRGVGRPRYLIDQADVAVFEQKREVVRAPTVRKRNRKKPAGVIEFF